MLLLVFVVISAGVVASTPVTKITHADAGLTVIEMVPKHGYRLETHTVTTEDGYILQMHRIPFGNQNECQMENKPAVLLMHGLTSSSVDWVNSGPDKALAYILSEQGYDVWMGNARGNKWSRKHQSLDPDSDKEQFWAFSWHEIGKYDLPALIDYVLEQTDEEQLFYVGHSQGTTAFFVMASERPEYNEKIRLMSALAPVAFMKNLKNPLVQFISPYERALTVFMNKREIYELLPAKDVNEHAQGCEEGSEHPERCTFLLFLICGYDPEQLDPSFVPVITSNLPAGTSTRQFLHYAQEVNSGEFQQYDYHLKNMEVYGQPTPPKYNIDNITAPIALYYGQNDLLSSVEDVIQLRDKLPNVVNDVMIKYDKFNHLDFLWAKDVVTLLYNDVTTKMEEYLKMPQD